MATASITELKANLSDYLRQAQRGGEVQILDGDTPIARIVPPKPKLPVDGDDPRQRLIAEGVLRPGEGNFAEILAQPPLDLGVSLLEALEEDREDRF